MKHIKVLVADDDPNVCEIIRLYFEKNDMSVVEANDGKQAIHIAKKEQPDFIILDIMMPELDGFEVCKELRKETNVPILMLTAKGDEFDRVLGLEIGADDYVTKPFSPRELVARIKAILRRGNGSAKNNQGDEPYEFTFGPLYVHLKRREVTVQGQKITFRPKEFDLLTYLIQNEKDVISREQLLEHVWGYDYFGDIRTVDVHIKKIRNKLNMHGLDCIHTAWGVGYRFEMMSDTVEEKGNR